MVMPFEEHCICNSYFQTGAKVIIRGKGSVKEGKVGRKDGLPMPGEDEPLHAFITGSTQESVTKCVERINKVIQQGIEIPESQNDLRKQQLRELALLNGTLRENEGLAKLKAIAEAQTIATNTIVCSACGGAGHLASDCKAKRDNLMCIEVRKLCVCQVTMCKDMFVQFASEAFTGSHF